MVLINEVAGCALQCSTSLGFNTEFGDTSDERRKFYEVDRLEYRNIRRASLSISCKFSSFDLIVPGLSFSAVERVQKRKTEDVTEYAIK